jgi:hypothetical protein
MRNGEITTINGAWNDKERAWVSDPLFLTGDCYLEVTLPGRGRMVIKKAETADGPWPRAKVTPWTGPEFKIRIYGSTKYRYVRIYLTETPTQIQFSNTQGYAVRKM